VIRGSSAVGSSRKSSEVDTDEITFPLGRVSATKLAAANNARVGNDSRNIARGVKPNRALRVRGGDGEKARVSRRYDGIRSRSSKLEISLARSSPFRGREREREREREKEKVLLLPRVLRSARSNAPRKSRIEMTTAGFHLARN